MIGEAALVMDDKLPQRLTTPSSPASALLESDYALSNKRKRSRATVHISLSDFS